MMQCLQQQGRRSCRPRQHQARARGRSSRRSRTSRAAAKLPDSGREQTLQRNESTLPHHQKKKNRKERLKAATQRLKSTLKEKRPANSASVVQERCSQGSWGQRLSDGQAMLSKKQPKYKKIKNVQKDNPDMYLYIHVNESIRNNNMYMI